MTSSDGQPRRRRRHPVVAALLAVEALLVVSPALAVAQLWQGAWIAAAGTRLRLPDTALQGVLHVAGPLLVVLLLLAALRVAAGSRGWAAVALAAQVGVLAHLAVPLLQPYPTLSGVPGGAVVLAAVAVAATVGSARVLLARGPRPRRSRTVRAVVLLVGLALLGGAAAGLLSPTLPSYPWSWLLSQGEGDGRGTPVPADAIPQNPGLAANPFNSIHDDSWATDAYALPGPRAPRTAPVDSVFLGGDCATVTFDSRGHLVTVCSSLRRVTAYVLDPRTLDILARETVGERSGGLTDFSSGGYFFLDDRDRIVLPTGDGSISVVAVRTGSDGGVTLVPELQIPLQDKMDEGERLTAVMPLWQGGYWFVGSAGTVGTASVDGRRVSVVHLRERVANSFAVTQDAAYVVTDAALYRLAAGPDGTPQVVWREGYDAGTRRKPGQTGVGSGTTPTVFSGGDLVAITDNAEPRMNVVVVRTGAGAAPRTVCRVPVFADGASATENSIIAVGDSLVVENNDGYDPPVTGTVGGATTTPGVVRIDVTPDGGCTTRWSNDVVSVPSVVSKASAPDGAMLTYTKPASWWGGDGWYLTALDLSSGAVLWTRLAGGGLAYNNHYAGVAIAPGGDLVVGAVYGLVVLRADD